MALALVEQLICTIDGYLNRNGKATIVVFITGRAGAGKTTLGGMFGTRQDFLHFDADQFAYGARPIEDAGKTIESHSKQNRSKQLIDVYDNLAVKHGYYALFDGKRPDLSVWSPFYDMLIAQIKTARLQHPDKHLAVSQSVYQRIVREYIRNAFGDDLFFVIINAKIEVSTKRVWTRTYDMAKDVGMTADEYLKSHGSSLQQVKTVTAPLIQKGFECMLTNEPNTCQIDVDETMTKQDVFNAAQKFVSTYT